MPECSPYPQPDDTWTDNTIDGFSAACWHFAEQLTDYMEANDEPVVPIGLIGSHWGGTMVEMWQPNATLNAQVSSSKALSFCCVSTAFLSVQIQCLSVWSCSIRRSARIQLVTLGHRTR
eukprot:SAG22_NODE_2529_length_2473_cov_3.477675_3_plen_119_part_00